VEGLLSAGSPAHLLPLHGCFQVVIAVDGGDIHAGGATAGGHNPAMRYCAGNVQSTRRACKNSAETRHICEMFSGSVCLLHNSGFVGRSLAGVTSYYAVTPAQHGRDQALSFCFPAESCNHDFPGRHQCKGATRWPLILLSQYKQPCITAACVFARCVGLHNNRDHTVSEATVTPPRAYRSCDMHRQHSALVHVMPSAWFSQLPKAPTESNGSSQGLHLKHPAAPAMGECLTCPQQVLTVALPQPRGPI
jgi:hypothetical protein